MHLRSRWIKLRKRWRLRNWALVGQHMGMSLHGQQAADARTDAYADALGVRFVDLETGISQRLLGGDNAEQAKFFPALRLLGCGQPILVLVQQG